MPRPVSPGRALDGEPGWPAARGRRLAFLLDASSALEERILRAWIERRRPADAAGALEAICIPPTRRRRRGTRGGGQALERCVASPDDPLLAPLRVAWLPGRRDGVRAARLSDLLTLGDPRDPGRLRAHWILRRQRDRCRVVAGDPAPLSELRARWRDAGFADASQTTGLAEFVARQAALALERAERRLRGARYKVPRLVHEDILARPATRAGIADLARRLGRPETALGREAARTLREIAATHSPFVIDLAAHAIRALYTQGYGEALRFEHEQLEGIAALGQRHPLVFLPSHKSHLDHLVLQYALHECGLPPNHTAGGINMNFFPVGPLVRRSGVFFIRRSFRDDPLYKFVLQQYVDYLVEKRFPLEWYIEGGRSRSGKLLPPRFGLLASVADAYRRGKSEDVILIPVSIAYDQIQDVGEYAAEQRGAAKRRESFGWFLGVVRRLRRRHGDIHIRFGEPLSLARALGPPDSRRAAEPDEHSLALQKLAFEVCVRINRATPLTPTALVALTLLGVGDAALSLDEVRRAMGNLLAYVRRRKLPSTRELGDLETPEGVARALQALVESGVVTCFAEGPEAVYAIGPDQHLTAAYYRNAICHFFVTAAIAELSLLRAGEAGAADPAAQLRAEALRLRDLLKFEFFFADKESFLGELREELALHHPAWERRLAAGGEEARALVREFRPLSAHRVLRPFLDAYQVVADALARRDPGAPLEDGSFLSECLALGRQYRLQRRIRSPESVSKALFGTGLRLARNRGLAEPGPADLAAQRAAFAGELRDARRRVDAVEALAAARRAGLIP